MGNKISKQEKLNREKARLKKLEQKLATASKLAKARIAIEKQKQALKQKKIDLKKELKSVKRKKLTPSQIKRLEKRKATLKKEAKKVGRGLKKAGYQGLVLLSKLAKDSK